MKLHLLPSQGKKANKRLGQGHGSGRGKTAGRGTKGLNARGKMPIGFEGGAVSLIKRLPFKRGKGRNNTFKKQAIIINVELLNSLPANTVVTLDVLVKHNIVEAADAKVYGVKILGDGELSIPLTVNLPTSQSAREKIEKAKGSVSIAKP